MLHALSLIRSLKGEGTVIFGMRPASGTGLSYAGAWLYSAVLLEVDTMHVARPFVNGRRGEVT